MQEIFLKAPPMGWNSWNTFMDGLDEATLREIAVSLKEQGFLEAGRLGGENPARGLRRGL